MKRFYTRINYDGELSDISRMVCQDYGLGTLVSANLVEVGYEDFNFILESAKGKYFVKIFSELRLKKDQECRRYVDIMLKAIQSGVSFPKLLKSSQGYLHITEVNGTRLRLCVMDFIEGQTFFAMKQKPSQTEVRELARQAAIINSIDIHPTPVYDSWAIVNIEKEFKRAKPYLTAEDLKVIEPLTKEFKALKVHELPHCFVHGDIIATNVLKDTTGKIWILDFAVSNWYPRIQELAVMACNLLFDESSKANTQANLEIALEEYQKAIKLTDRELEVLPGYIRFAQGRLGL